jgi:hypothetical protein
MKGRLIELSLTWRVSFVVGLNEDRPGKRRCNVAYLIDNTPGNARIEQLSWKHNEPMSEGTPNPYFCVTPIRHRGFGIGTLICNDFMDCLQADRQTLLEHPNWVNSSRKVLCVPAASSGPRLYERRKSEWPDNICVAAANGDDRDWSFVHGGGFHQRFLTDCHEYVNPSNEILLSETLHES